jgi:hypothetical protein
LEDAVDTVFKFDAVVAIPVIVPVKEPSKFATIVPTEPL